MCTPTSRPSGTAASVMLDRRMARGPPPPSASNRGRIFKTLVVSVDGRFVLAVVPVDRELDLKRLAEVTGARRAEMAEQVNELGGRKANMREGASWSKFSNPKIAAMWG